MSTNGKEVKHFEEKLNAAWTKWENAKRNLQLAQDALDKAEKEYIVLQEAQGRVSASA